MDNVPGVQIIMQGNSGDSICSNQWRALKQLIICWEMEKLMKQRDIKIEIRLLFSCCNLHAYICVEYTWDFYIFHYTLGRSLLLPRCHDTWRFLINRASISTARRHFLPLFLLPTHRWGWIAWNSARESASSAWSTDKNGKPDLAPGLRFRGT